MYEVWITYTYEILILTSILCQMISADANFSVVGNLNVLPVDSLQHQAIPQEQWPSTPAGWQVFCFKEELNSHSPTDTFLTPWYEDTEQRVWSYTNAFFYLFFYLPSLHTPLLLVSIISIVLDFSAPCLPVEGGIFALSSLPFPLRWSSILPVLWGMTEMKQLRQGHSAFSFVFLWHTCISDSDGWLLFMPL